MKYLLSILLGIMVWPLIGQVQLKAHSFTDFLSDGTVFFIDSTAITYQSDQQELFTEHKPTFYHGNDLLYRSFYPYLAFENVHYLKPEGHQFEFERIEKYRFSNGSNSLIREQVLTYTNGLPSANTIYNAQGNIMQQAVYSNYNGLGELETYEIHLEDSGTVELYEAVDLFYDSGFPTKRTTLQYANGGTMLMHDSIVKYGDTLITVFKGNGIPVSKIDYRFENGALLSVLQYTGPQNNQLGDKYRFQYDAQGRVRRIFRDLRNSDGTLTVAYETRDYGYNADNNIATVKFYGNNAEPVGYWTYAYVEQAYVSEIKIYSSSPGNWIEQLSAQRNFYYDENLGISENESFSFEVYPNPTSGAFTIASAHPIQTVEIYNLQGKLIMEKQLNAKEAKLNLSPGIYQVKVGANGHSHVKKVVVF